MYVKERQRLPCLLITELRFDAMLCSNLGDENYDSGHIKCSRGPHVPHPWSNWQRCCNGGCNSCFTKLSANTGKRQHLWKGLRGL